MAKKQGYLKKKQTFSSVQVLLFVLVFAVVGAVAIWQSLAAPHSGGKGCGKKCPVYSGTLSAPVLVTDKNADGSVNYGDVITFNVTSNASYYFVELDCMQAGTRVYNNTIGFYPGWPWPKNYYMESSLWTGGAADCTAILYASLSDGTNRQNITTQSFHVNA